ncbi:MAG: hypothetical protein O7D91_13215 [Planctomycetota bacterium]|nr:hypothetical protein [Planctomycetota bacterium]
MDRRIYRHAELWLVIAAVGGTSLFAPAAMARMAEECFLAQAQRKNTDTPVDESDKPRELLADQQYLNWDRSVSKISKPPLAKQLTAVAWRMLIRSAGPSEFDSLLNPQSDSPAGRQSELNTSWPHAPPFAV